MPGAKGNVDTLQVVSLLDKERIYYRIGIRKFKFSYATFVKKFGESK